MAPTMARTSTGSNDDPITWVLRTQEERANETPQQREERIEREAKAKIVSDEIDERIRQERETAKKDAAVELLLLGQSESGKSTTLKQFQIMSDHEAFDRQRGAWRSIVYLNMIRSVRRILNLVTQWVEEDKEDMEDADPVLLKHISRFKEIKIRLSPLLSIEHDLLKEMGVIDQFESYSPPTPGFVPLPNTEYFARANSSWLGNLFRRKESSSHAAAADPAKGPGHIVVACGADVIELWNNEFVRRVLKKGNLRLEDDGGFFLDDLPRITARNFVPSDNDIVRCRLKTIGVAQHQFTMRQRDMYAKTTQLRIYDVGGSRSQRAAWAPYFDTCKAIVFLAPISAFDQYLEEDPRVNRIKDSLDLWKDLTKNRILESVPIVLFLNKCDLLKAKLEAGIKVSDHITSYTGPNEFEPVSEYLRRRFAKLAASGVGKTTRDIHIHLTTMTDAEASSSVLMHIQEILMRESLRDYY